MAKRPKELISRAFRQDFPQFVERAKSLGVRIQLSQGRQPAGRVFWLDGYRQLTGYSTKKGGEPFTRADAIANIDKALTEIEEDRALMATMSQNERFARVVAEFRQIVPQYRMFNNVHLPGGDGGSCFALQRLSGSVRLHEIGTVAEAETNGFPRGNLKAQMATFCDLLEADYAARKNNAAA